MHNNDEIAKWTGTFYAKVYATIIFVPYFSLTLKTPPVVTIPIQQWVYIMYPLFGLETFIW